MVAGPLGAAVGYFGPRLATTCISYYKQNKEQNGRWGAIKKLFLNKLLPNLVAAGLTMGLGMALGPVGVIIGTSIMAATASYATDGIVKKGVNFLLEKVGLKTPAAKQKIVQKEKSVEILKAKEPQPKRQTSTNIGHSSLAGILATPETPPKIKRWTPPPFKRDR